MNARNSLIGLGLGIALFLAINLFMAPALRGARVDLTEQKLYTLSQGTRNILGNLEEPIRLRFFFSKGVAQDIPPILTYAERVREMLEEYVAASNGKLELELIDPEPFSEAEELAVGFGVQGRVANDERDRLYFGIVGTNSVDDEELLPVLDPRRESFLEYELTEMIDRLENPELPVVGLVSSLPLRGGSMPAPQPDQEPIPLEPWPILDLVQRRYQIRDLPIATLTEIPEEVDLLLLIHPKGLTPVGLYAIDQFALRGGKVVAFVDPHCYFDPIRMTGDPMAILNAGSDSGIDQLLLAWGVAMQPGRIVGDGETALVMPDRQGNGVRMPLAFDVTSDTIDEDDILTATIEQLRVFTPGTVAKSEDAPDGANVEVLVTATGESGTVDAMTLLGGMDPQVVSDSFLANSPSLPLAVRVSGDVRTSFTNGPPDGAPTNDGAPSNDGAPTNGDDAAPEDEAPTEGDDAEGESTDGHLAKSVAPFNAVVIADVDMLYVSIWGRLVEDIFGNRRIRPTTGNAALLVGALENLSGSNDLISLRSRAEFNRPFTRKQDLQRNAEERYRAEELELEAKLADTQRQIDELEAEKDPNSGVLISPEQEEKIAQFRAESLETRRRLRQVRRDLRAEIDALGTRLKLINILLIPAIIAALVASVHLARRGSKRGSSKGAAA